MNDMNSPETKIQALENILNYHNKNGDLEDAEKVKAEIKVLKAKLPKKSPAQVPVKSKGEKGVAK